MSDLEALASLLGHDSGLLDLDDPDVFDLGVDDGGEPSALCAAERSATATGGGGGSAGVKRGRAESVGDDTDDGRRVRRLALNRASARECRRRKKVAMCRTLAVRDAITTVRCVALMQERVVVLEAQVTDLEREKRVLQEELAVRVAGSVDGQVIVVLWRRIVAGVA